MAQRPVRSPSAVSFASPAFFRVIDMPEVDVSNEISSLIKGSWPTKRRRYEPEYFSRIAFTTSATFGEASAGHATSWFRSSKVSATISAVCSARR